MNIIKVEASRVIDARPEQVYAVLSDYRVAHPAILPKRYFTELTVEKGGQGAGTITRVKMKVFGRVYTFHQAVTEPEPGRVLVETDIATGQFTRFSFEPLNGGQQVRVTFYSEFPGSGGVTGWLERLMQPAFVRRIYNEELQILADYVENKRSAVALQNG